MFFGPQITLFRLMGFPIKLDMSWLIIFALLTWSLSTGLFPQLVPNLATGTYIAMGAIGAIGLFVCILLHELSHAAVARQQGLGIRGITLFIFGGVAEMADEPRSARAEFLVAVAGPIMSLALGVLLYAGALSMPDGPVRAVIWWLAIVNFILVVFNMLPAFPLDGGRIFRSIVWHAKKDLQGATRVSARVGLWIGAGLIGLGLLRIVLGDFVGGLWFALIGMFLRGAARMSYQQLLMRRALEGESIRRFMRTEVVTVPPEITLSEFVDSYVYRHQHKMFPVTADDGRLLGCITTRDVQKFDRDQWAGHRVGEAMQHCGPDNTIAAHADAMAALAKINRTNQSRLMVLEHDRLAGIITLKDLLRFISLKVELEEGGASNLPASGLEGPRPDDEPRFAPPRERSSAARR